MSIHSLPSETTPDRALGGASGDTSNNKPWVLIADDLDGVRKTAKKLLTKGGFNVHIVANGYEATEYMKNQNNPVHYKAIIMDNSMPLPNGLKGRIKEISGIEATQIIKGTSPVSNEKEQQNSSSSSLSPSSNLHSSLSPSASAHLNDNSTLSSSLELSLSSSSSLNSSSSPYLSPSPSPSPADSSVIPTSTLINHSDTNNQKVDEKSTKDIISNSSRQVDCAEEVVTTTRGSNYYEFRVNLINTKPPIIIAHTSESENKGIRDGFREAGAFGCIDKSHPKIASIVENAIKTAAQFQAPNQST